MHQVTVTPFPVNAPMMRPRAPTCGARSFAWDGFSQMNSFMQTSGWTRPAPLVARAALNGRYRSYN
ncbi:hypothetical protein [Caballeronia sp. LZ001]|uniref:hypothetical protein n=1 Tax=Caballeronia sp. LZ001 TaxID=3038553 RepID=UPI00286506A6|nr:hypothetical protein [Caballeronia sp. LZ001]MDR5804908.1 hypothetical protein [Caballeronia sp. LZ001]